MNGLRGFLTRLGGGAKIASSCSPRNKSSSAGFWLVTLLVCRLAADSAGVESQSFRFAFLSDTHVGSQTAEEDLRASVRDINSLTGLSFVVLSGDVTEYGSLQQLRLARQILGDLKIPCHVLPGNHDTKWSESGATDFARLWGNDRFSFDHGGFRIIGMHQGPLMKMGDGHWAPQDVRWLKEILQDLRDSDQPLIFITHYPMDKGIANWFAVLDLLKQYNTQVVLCGHGHSNRKLNFEGVPGVMGRSNLRASQPTGGFNLVEVKDGQMTFVERVPGRETRPPWHSVPLGKRNYAGDTNAYPRPDFSVNARYPWVKPLWRFDTGYTIASTPAVWKDSAIVGDASGSVYSFGLKSGEIRWKFKASGVVYSSPDTAAESVVFAATDGVVYALNPANGAALWRHPTERPIVASPRISGEVVYLGASDGVFRALRLRDGQALWQFRGVEGFVETRPLVHEDKVIFGAWDEHLYALAARTGALLWKWRSDRPGVLYSPAACWPVADQDKVFIAAPDRNLTALDAKTGEEVWRSGDFMVRESIGISEDGSRIYVRAMQDFIHALSTRARQPEKVWQTNAGFGYDINSAMLVETGGTVLYGTKNGLLLALDARTGALQWQHKLGVGLVNTVVPLTATEVLATDFDGQVILISAAK